MKQSLTSMLLKGYKADRSNRLYVSLSEEDYEYLYKVFPEAGVGGCLATLLLATFLNKLRSANITNYNERLQSKDFANLETVISDVIGYQPSQEADEPDDDE